MGRKRRLDIGDPELTIREFIIRHNIDPVDHMLRMVKETIPYPDKELMDKNPGFLKQLIDDGYAPYIDHEAQDPETGKKGVKRLRLNKRMQVDILKAIAPYMYSQQKAVEVKNTHDYNIQVTINYGGSKEPKKIEMESQRIIPEAIDVEVKE